MLRQYFFYARTILTIGFLGYSSCSLPGNIDKTSLQNKDKQNKTETKQTNKKHGVNEITQEIQTLRR